MKSFTLESTDTTFLLKIDKDAISRDLLTELVERIHLETLLKKADFDEDIETLGEEIKANWWKNNKDRIIGYSEK